jgi:hypothetical protein
LIAEAKPLSVYAEMNGRGYGRLKNKAQSYQQMGLNGLPVLMLTDLDNAECAASLKREWLGQNPTSNFLFRVCVREIESWLLGHHLGIAELLRISPSLVPPNPEDLANPKAELIRLARRSPAKIRNALTPVGTSTIGPGYNEVVEAFIREKWVPRIAAERCPSLCRTRMRISELAGRVSS